MKQTKKILSILMSVCLVLGLIPGINFSSLLISANEEEHNVLQELFPDINEEDVPPDAKAENVPYRDGSALISVRELLYGSTGSRTANLYGKNARLATTMNQTNGYLRTATATDQKLPAAALIGGKEYPNLELLSIHTSYEGDFDDDGKKDELAIVLSARSRISTQTNVYTSLLLLCVGDAEFSQPFTPLYVIEESSNGGDGKAFDNPSADYQKVVLTTGDLNGNSVDEVIFSVLDSESKEWGNLWGIHIWSLVTENKNPNPNGWMSADNWYETVNKDGYYARYEETAGVSLSMATGDIDRDGFEDIVWIGSNSYFSSAGKDYISILFGSKNLSDLKNPCKEFYLPNVSDTPTVLDYRRTSFGITIADMDGDGNKQILVAYKQAFRIFNKHGQNFDFYFNNNPRLIVPEYSVMRLDLESRNQPFVSQIIYTGGLANPGADDYTLYKGHRDISLPMQIAKLDYDYGRTSGVQHVISSGSIVVNGVIHSFVKRVEGGSYKYNTKYEARVTPTPTGKFFTNTPLAQCVDNKNEVINIRRAVVSGDSDGFLIHYRNGSAGMVAYYDQRSSTTDSKTAEYEKKFESGYVNTWYYTALPDLDDDSVYLNYTGEHYFFWSDPVIIAALISPPYFKSLPDESYRNGTTTYGKTGSSSTGTTSSVTTSVGSYISVEAEAGSPWVKGVFESEFEYSDSQTIEAEKSETISYTQGFSAASGEDVIVLTTAAFDAYRYKVIIPINDDGASGTKELDYMVVVPRGGASAMKLATVNLDDYNAIRKYAENAMPNLSGVFSHTVGKPESYPSAPPAEGGNIVKGSVMQHTGFAGFPSGFSSNSLGMEITKEKTSKTSTSSSVSVKLGGGVSMDGEGFAGGKFTAGASYGTDTDRGSFLANAEGLSYEGVVYGQNDGFGADKAYFNWRLMRYVYTNNPNYLPDIDTLEFPVIGYTVTGVTQPKGTIPTGVTVSPTSQKLEQVGPKTPGFKNTADFNVSVTGLTREARTELVGAPRGMYLVTENISSSAVQPLAISINANTPPGIYPLRLEVGGVLSNQFTIEVKSRLLEYNLDSDKKDIKFPASKLHFDEYVCPEEQHITIKNIGNKDLYSLWAELGDGQTSKFEITKGFSSDTLAPNETAVISVKPKASGLLPGVHTDILTVTDGDSYVNINLSFTISPPDVPAAPTSISWSVTSLGIRIDISSIVVNPGGNPILYYEVSNDGGASWVQVQTTQSTYTFGNLKTGTAYETHIRAVNAGGVGASKSQIFTVPNLPATPQNFTAIPLDGKVFLMWDPADDGTGNFTSLYTVQTYLAFGGEERTAISKECEYMVTGLTNGREYVFNLINSNIVGTVIEGRLATPLANPIPAAPSIPKSFKATAHNKRVELTWTAPTFNGNIEILYYEVSSDNGETWVRADNSTGHSFAGLTNNLLYNFKVRAVNNIGSGREAKISATPVTGITSPAILSDSGGTALNSQISLRWTPSVDENGSPVSDYEISKDGGVTWNPANSLRLNNNFYWCPVDGLNNNQTYDFRIRAVNGDGYSKASQQMSIYNNTPKADVPSVPLEFTATPGNGNIRLNWKPPADNEGGQTLSYILSVSEPSSLSPIIWATPVSFSGGTDAIVSGLDNGKTYIIRLQAENDAGLGSIAYVIATPTDMADVPEAPQNLVITPGDECIMMTWEAPANDYGSPVTGYMVSIDGGELKKADSETGHIFSGLTNDRIYTFRVFAVNAIGMGPQIRGIGKPQAGATGVPIQIMNASVSITVPLADAAPNKDAAIVSGNFTASDISWMPGDESFRRGVEYTASVTLTAESGYTFIGLKTATVNGQPASFIINSNETATLSYRFAETGDVTLDSYVITVTEKEGGTTTGGGTFVSGTEVTLTATPENGYIFEGWYENGVKIADAGKVYTFTIDADRLLEARFIEDEENYGEYFKDGTGSDYTITKDSNGEGYITSGISIGDIVENLANSLADGINVYDKEGTPIDSGKLTTGMKIKNEASGTEITVVIKGDVTGNGEPSINDARTFLEHLVGNNLLEGAYEKAAEDFFESSAIKSLRNFLHFVMNL